MLPTKALSTLELLVDALGDELDGLVEAGASLLLEEGGDFGSLLLPLGAELLLQLDDVGDDLLLPGGLNRAGERQREVSFLPLQRPCTSSTPKGTYLELGTLGVQLLGELAVVGGPRGAQAVGGGGGWATVWAMWAGWATGGGALWTQGYKKVFSA